MLEIKVFIDGDGIWPDLADNPNVVHMGNDTKPLQIAFLNGGMVSGRPSVSIRLDLPDGGIVIAETSAASFCQVARVFMAHHPDMLE